MSNVQGRGRKKNKESGSLPKCCTIKIEEEVGCHILQASKSSSSAMECGCNHYTHLRRDNSRLANTLSVSLSCFFFFFSQYVHLKALVFC